MEVMSGAIEQDAGFLVESAAAGDEVAFARIVASYEAEMFRICVVVGRDRQVAADAVQAAWAIAWLKPVTLREPARLRPWLVSIAVNETRQLLNLHGALEGGDLSGIVFPALAITDA